MPFKTGLHIKTFEVTATLGLNIGYSKNQISIDEAIQAIGKAACTIDGFTFSGTVTLSQIIIASKSKVSSEPALIVQSSIYPRFPENTVIFKQNFTQFIGNLATLLKQERVALRFSDESFMLETEHCTKPDLK